MNFRPSPLQTLVLFRLVFTGEEPKQSELKQLQPKSRRQLLQAGFIELEKRGRAHHIVLTDKAWQWVGDNLDAQISRAARTNEAFSGLLARLNRFLTENDLALAEFIQSPSSIEAAAEDTFSRVRAAYFKLSGGVSNIRVRLKDLRQELSGISQAELNQVLLDLQSRGKLVLMHLDDPRERTSADEAAAIDLLGHKRHIVYMEDAQR